MSANGLARCAEIAPLLVFYACDEVEPQEREQIDAHLAVVRFLCGTASRRTRDAKRAGKRVSTPPISSTPPELFWRSAEANYLSCWMICRRRRCASDGARLDGRVNGWLCGRRGARAVLVVAGLVVGTQVALWIPSRDGNFGGQAMKRESGCADE